METKLVKIVTLKPTVNNRGMLTSSWLDVKCLYLFQKEIISMALF